MSIPTLEKTPGLDGDRSATALAGARRETASPEIGRKANPEVAAVARRRQHRPEYKLRILAEVDENPEQTGVILRREGLYSSSLTNWRRWREKMSAEKKGPTRNKQLHNELAKAKRENTRLTLKLKRAEGVIELQKKAAEMLSLMSQSENDETS